MCFGKRNRLAKGVGSQDHTIGLRLARAREPFGRGFRRGRHPVLLISTW